MATNESLSASLVNFLKYLVQISDCPTGSEFAQVSNITTISLLYILLYLLLGRRRRQSIESERENRHFTLPLQL